MTYETIIFIAGAFFLGAASMGVIWYYYDDDLRDENADDILYTAADEFDRLRARIKELEGK